MHVKEDKILQKYVAQFMWKTPHFFVTEIFSIRGRIRV